jgi:hypothetical protein
MNRRRFMYLAIALVALNTFFWLAGGGMALSQAVISRFFGNNMVRAEVLVQSGGVVQDWRIDRGVITAISGSSITLRELDGTSVTVEVSPTAHVQGPFKYATLPQLKRRLRVVLYHQANLPAELVQVEGGGR